MVALDSSELRDTKMGSKINTLSEKKCNCLHSTDFKILGKIKVNSINCKGKGKVH